MNRFKPENYTYPQKESLDWYRSRLDLWVAFCRKYRVAEYSVPLFDCDEGGFVRTREAVLSLTFAEDHSTVLKAFTL